ncbi:MAG: hypothetical protein KH111_03215 [Bacteroidales bacterium]|nr:hypothetical protein [Bacteroidales bacterium]
MASLKNDFGLSGKLGDVVIYRVGNKSYVRRACRANDPNSEKQQEVRARFTVALRFYQKLKETSLRGILKISAQGICSNGYAFYMQTNLKVFRADGHIGDFSQLQFSAGKRQRAYYLRGRIKPDGCVALRWRIDEGKGTAELEDRLMVVVLCEGRAFCPRVLENTGVVRRDGAASFTVEGWKGETLHVYCFFVSPDEKQLSISQYVRLQEEQ